MAEAGGDAEAGSADEESVPKVEGMGLLLKEVDEGLGDGERVPPKGEEEEAVGSVGADSEAPEVA